MIKTDSASSGQAHAYKVCDNVACGKAFQPYRPFQKYCSDKCRYVVTKRRRDRDKVGETERACKKCSVLFMSKGKHHKFCSRACTDAYWATRNKPKEKRACAHCGTAFESSHWSKRYCTEECYLAKARERRQAP